MKKILPIIIVFFFSNPVFAWTWEEIDQIWMHCFAYEELPIGHKYEFCGCMPQQYLLNFNSQNDVISLADRGDKIFNNDSRIINIYKTCDKRISGKKSYSGYSLDNLNLFWGTCMNEGRSKNKPIHASLAYCGCIVNELTKKIDFNKFQRIENSLVTNQNQTNDILYLKNNLSKTCSNKVF
jgi:hypothetical protein